MSSEDTVLGDIREVDVLWREIFRFRGKFFGGSFGGKDFVVKVEAFDILWMLEYFFGLFSHKAPSYGFL